ncbi:hypothetical protein JNK13_12085 [bacterium]|nr:hypothetical protein [bacterium]
MQVLFKSLLPICFLLEVLSAQTVFAQIDLTYSLVVNKQGLNVEFVLNVTNTGSEIAYGLKPEFTLLDSTAESTVKDIYPTQTVEFKNSQIMSHPAEIKPGAYPVYVLVKYSDVLRREYAARLIGKLLTAIPELQTPFKLEILSNSITGYRAQVTNLSSTPYSIVANPFPGNLTNSNKQKILMPNSTAVFEVSLEKKLNETNDIFFVISGANQTAHFFNFHGLKQLEDEH